MDEAALITYLRARCPWPPGSLGIGDDCCVWQPRGTTCLSVDSIVEGQDFLADAPPALIGRKAAATALSDLAAMGAVPRGAAVSLNCPPRWDAIAVMDGCLTELERHGCPLLGGDTSAAGILVIAVTVWGEVGAGGRLLARSGGRAGDLLAVTGRLGGSLASGRHFRPEPRLAEGQWLASREGVHALIDLSDGLAADAPRLAAAGGCGCLLDAAAIPGHPDIIGDDKVHAVCCDGEDYELLAAVDAALWPRLLADWPFAELPFTAIGNLQAQLGCMVRWPSGSIGNLPWRGYAHEVGGTEEPRG